MKTSFKELSYTEKQICMDKAKKEVEYKISNMFKNIHCKEAEEYRFIQINRKYNSMITPYAF